MDYHSKAIYANDKLIIALELYLGKDHKFYTDAKYIKQNFEERQMMPDIVSNYALGKIPPPNDKTLLAQMIYFGKELYPGMKVLMVHVLSSLQTDQTDLVQKNQGSFVDYYPAVWYQNFEGGNIWITTLGHSKESYQDPVYKNHLLQGIKYIANQYKGLNYANAHAVAKDDPLKK